ncbi:papain family cysteine protease domain-containing protein [Phthorimaea operculella]|nr:papain family cysteine protease domain-containing protein [Phthorimaea operculella]
MLVVYLLLLCAGAMAFVPPTLYDLEAAEDLFEEFINNHNKEYASEQEKQYRFNVFKENLKKINELRLKKEKATTHGINSLSDWTRQEFQALLGLKPQPTFVETVTINMTIGVPDSLDWRQQNVVTPVKDQKRCNSCWTFSTTGAIEAAYALKHGQLLSFSEQQILDCDPESVGCGSGGFPTKALDYLQSAGGIELESDYPYEIRKDQCRYNPSQVKATVTGQNPIDLSEVDATKQALVNYGPLSIGVDSDTWQYYTGGLHDCPDTESVNHAVLLIGYGTSEDGRPYWLIKNSWGQRWGEGGYIRIPQTGTNDNHVCAMAASPGISAIVA